MNGYHANQWQWIHEKRLGAPNHSVNLQITKYRKNFSHTHTWKPWCDCNNKIPRFWTWIHVQSCFNYTHLHGFFGSTVFRLHFLQYFSFFVFHMRPKIWQIIELLLWPHLWQIPQQFYFSILIFMHEHVRCERNEWKKKLSLKRKMDVSTFLPFLFADEIISLRHFLIHVVCECAGISYLLNFRMHDYTNNITFIWVGLEQLI